MCLLLFLVTAFVDISQIGSNNGVTAGCGCVTMEAASHRGISVDPLLQSSPNFRDLHPGRDDQ
jgi:hypothetical protein